MNENDKKNEVCDVAEDSLSKAEGAEEDGAEDKSTTHWLPLGMCLGISVGMAIGAAMGNIGVGICLGVGMGSCFGALLDALKKNR